MRRFAAVVLLAAAACSSGSSGGGGTGAPSVPLLPGFNPGAAPAEGTGFQIILPIVSDIEPGGSYEYCTWTDVTTTTDVWLKSTQGLQTETGHHVIVYYTQTPLPAGTSRICSDSDMAGFRFASGAGGEGVTEKNVMPGDLAVHVPAGSQIVINHHYLNAGTTAVPQAQSAVNVLYADPNSTIVQASSLAFVDTAMSVPPGLNSVDITCNINQAFSTWYMVPHMHNYGTHITVDHITPTTTDRLFDLDWDPSFAFHPPDKTEDPTAPYMLAAGDQIHVHCDYNNTTNAPITFGVEMCVAYMQTVDPTNVGNMACDAGQWGPF